MKFVEKCRILWKSKVGKVTIVFPKRQRFSKTENDTKKN